MYGALLCLLVYIHDQIKFIFPRLLLFVRWNNFLKADKITSEILVVVILDFPGDVIAHLVEALCIGIDPCLAWNYLVILNLSFELLYILVSQ